MQVIFRHNKGFSLIEISLALLIIAGLVGITIYGYNRVRNSNSVNTGVQETMNLIESFRQWAGTRVLQNPSSTYYNETVQYTSSNSLPKTLQAEYGGYVSNSDFKWHLTTYQTVTSVHNKNYRVS